MRFRGWGIKLGSFRDFFFFIVYKGVGVFREFWVLLFIY